MTPKYVFIDLDRTLLDTEQVMGALFAQCQQLYDIPAAALQANAAQFYHGQGTGQYYDFFGLLQTHDIDPQEAHEDLLAAIDQDFMYPDAHDMLQFLTQTPYKLHVLSFGKHDFQQFKFRLAPQLHSLPFTSILYDKARYLAEAGPGRKLLIDDKFIEPLPADSHQFVIDRAAAQDIAKTGPQHTTIRSLQLVETLLSK